MDIVFRQTQLYKFLKYCDDYGLEKTVLDCGAGGSMPPLALFNKLGYNTFGIEFSDAQIEKSEKFSEEHNLKLNIIKGDMRSLPFKDNTFSYVYSYNAVFHMTKADMKQSVEEMKRVLKPGGLFFVNFLTTNDFSYGEGKELEKGEFLQKEDNEEVIHTYYEEDEGDFHFKDMKIVFKENRVLERVFEGQMIKQGYVDYIARK